MSKKRWMIWVVGLVFIAAIFSTPVYRWLVKLHLFDNQYTGQMFVVTKNRENIKMGGASIYVLKAEMFDDLLREAHRKYLFDVARHQATSELHQAQIKEIGKLREAIKEISENLMKFYGIRQIPRLNELTMEINRLEPATVFSMPNANTEFDYVLDLLTAHKIKAFCITNADGRFVFSLDPKLGLEYFIVAKEQRQIVTENEEYRWIKFLDLKRYDAGEREIILSNDSMINAQWNLMQKFKVSDHGVTMTSTDSSRIDVIERIDPQQFIVDAAEKFKKFCADIQTALQQERQKEEEQQIRQQQREKELAELRARSMRVRVERQAILNGKIERLELVNGTVYTNVKVSGFDATGIRIFTSDGVIKIPYEALNEDWRNKFFDPLESKNYW